MDFDPANLPEPSSLLGFSQNRLFRDTEHRDEQSLPDALAHPNVRLYLYAGSRVVIQKKVACQFSKEQAVPFKPKYENAILLGHTNDGPIIGVGIGVDADALEEPFEAIDFRTMLYSDVVGDEDCSAIAQGGSVSYWNRMNRFCGKCGTASEMKIGGYRRDCPNCDSRFFRALIPSSSCLRSKAINACLAAVRISNPVGFQPLRALLNLARALRMQCAAKPLKKPALGLDRSTIMPVSPGHFPIH